MFCSQCGSEVGEGAQFCAACGAPVGTSPHEKGAMKGVAEKGVDLTKKAAEKAKPIAEAAVGLTGRALVKLGEATQRAGKRLKKEQG